MEIEADTPSNYAPVFCKRTPGSICFFKGLIHLVLIMRKEMFNGSAANIIKNNLLTTSQEHITTASHIRARRLKGLMWREVAASELIHSDSKLV